MTDIQLFSYPTSPYAQKVACYLKYKQLEFKFIGVNPISSAEIAFTRQRQVPVMQIGDEWRKESSELGIWLDELYPERPILPNDQQSRDDILLIDQWISNSLIPSVFRYAVEWQNAWYSITNGWRLSRAVSNATPLPLYVRILWPWGVKRAAFIVNMVEKMDLTESIPDMNKRLQDEFLKHLAGGPFLGNQANITLADLSAFPIITNGHFMGMKTKQSLKEHPEILAWAKRVYAELPMNPTLVPDKLLRHHNLG